MNVNSRIRKSGTLFLVVLLLFCVSCKKSQVRLSGVFENANKRYMLLSRIEPDEVIFLDTVWLSKGKFSYVLTEESIGVYLLKYNDTTLLSFLARSGEKLLFSGDAKDLNTTYDVQGSDETRLLLETRRRLNQFYDKSKAWSVIFLQHTYKDDYEEVSAHLDSLFHQEFSFHKEYLTQFIHQHNGNLAALLAFYQKIGNHAFFDEQKDRALLQEIHTALSQTYPNSIYVEDLKEKLEEREY